MPTPLSLPLRTALFLSVCFSCASLAQADKLRITSTPPGAAVEINGVPVGLTPLEIDYPGGFFHKTKTTVGKRLAHPLVARVRADGYAVKEVQLTEGPTDWISLKGHNLGPYWLLKTNHFDVKLDLIAATFTGKVSAHIDTGNATLAPELSLEALVAAVKPAVVQLFGLQKMGSGFFISDTGVIATNAHVARDESSLRVELSNNQSLQGSIVYIDEDLDIALVKVPGENFSHLVLADDQTVRQGETVFAMGNPSGAMQFSVTKGIVSAVGKFREAGSGTWIQTDAQINQGNSGGPLINLRGEVVGLNTLKMIKKNTSGIAFALSATDLLEVLHRFYPDTVPPVDAVKTASSQRAPEKMSASTSAGPATLPQASATGKVTFTGTQGAEIYIDDHFVGSIPSSLPLSSGSHKIRVHDGKSADWLKILEVYSGGEITLLVEFPPR